MERSPWRTPSLPCQTPRCARGSSLSCLLDPLHLQGQLGPPAPAPGPKVSSDKPAGTCCPHICSPHTSSPPPQPARLLTIIPARGGSLGLGAGPSPTLQLSWGEKSGSARIPKYPNTLCSFLPLSQTAPCCWNALLPPQPTTSSIVFPWILQPCLKPHLDQQGGP